MYPSFEARSQEESTGTSARYTLAKTEIIYTKNVRAKVAMDKCSAPRTIKKNENSGNRFGATS